jgi:recombination protein RecR
MLPESIENFVRSFSKLPGIGKKTAEKLGFYILTKPRAFSDNLAASIVELKEKTRECSVCGNISDSDPCPICSDAGRDGKLLCVVESALDIYIVEETKTYHGKYFVLGGLLSPLDGITPDSLGFDRLKRNAVENGVGEVGVALSPTTEGDTTALYIRELFQGADVRVTNLARGIPIGADLQYAGSLSIAQAIRNREELK